MHSTWVENLLMKNLRVVILKLKEKVALITGGSRGIGKAIAVEFAKEGADIAILFRNNVKEANKTIEEIIKLGRKAIAKQCDITDYDMLENSLNEIFEELGRVDILINNAGITNDCMLKKMDRNKWHNVIKTNLISINYCTEFIIRDMKKRKRGIIINISSLGGLMGNIGQANYSTSKAAIIGLTENLASNLSDYGIRVNVIAPGCIDTDMIRDVPEKIVQRMLERIPLSRFGKVEDIASAALFLASQDAKNISGHTFIIDGGLSLAIT